MSKEDNEALDTLHSNMRIIRSSASFQESNGMRVLVAVDGSRLSFKACTIARKFIGDSGHMTLLHVSSEKSSVMPPEILVREFRHHMRVLCLPTDQHNIILLGTGDADSSSPADKRIVRYANEKGFDFYIMGVFGSSGPSAFSKGSKTDFALRNCKSNAIIIKPESVIPRECHRIMIALDGRPFSINVVKAAIPLIRPNDKVMLFSIRLKGRPLSKTTAQAKKILEQHGISFTSEIEDKVPGQPIYLHIRNFSEEFKATLLCIGVDGIKEYYRGQRMIGSVTDKLVMKCRTSLVLVRDERHLKKCT